MDNRNYRDDREVAIEKRRDGFFNQLKGNVKELLGSVMGDSALRREGRRDELKGRLQEQHGELKEREARLEDDINEIERNNF
jgi:uncharacterized protein YjbJ (UPF0337 family)